MDPLGARPNIVDADTIARWSSSDPEGPPPNVDDSQLPSSHVISPFPVREDLNTKVALWSGDIASLQVEAVVNPTNEGLTDKNPITVRLFEMAGPELREECKTQIGTCRTGEAKISAAYQLPARHVIHTVGPRYNPRYRTAAESALYNCYRSVMQIMRNRHLATVAFSMYNSSRRGYPPEEGAHIAIRTIRRFLEHFGDDIDMVIFVSSDGNDAVYRQTFPLYFPRSAEEESYAAKALPASIGDEMGEPIITERQIRILENPTTKGASPEDGEEVEEVEISNDDTNESELISEVGSHPFSAMSSDHDQERREHISRTRLPSAEEAKLRRYQNFLRASRTENFSDLAGLGAFYKAGTDYLGRQVVVFVGRQFPAPKVDLAKAIAFFLHVMEPVVSRDYVLIYFHSLVLSENLPDSNFIKDIYNLVDDKYRDHLAALYIVHPNWWFKMSCWWFLTFTGSAVKEKIQYLTGVRYLYDSINPDQIEIPNFILEHDIQVNGTNYYTPATRHGDDQSGGL
ncbi:protein GDAP2 homolog [Halichondria panicea]|uniref:protein GDAP2 homolog n=1 Tax=Halichondria panicea TaxID=6063 RepID=UPI00312B9F7B